MFTQNFRGKDLRHIERNREIEMPMSEDSSQHTLANLSTLANTIILHASLSELLFLLL